MSTHVESHCATPKRIRRRDAGDLWACDCGQVWRITLVAGHESTFKCWRKYDLPTNKRKK